MEPLAMEMDPFAEVVSDEDHAMLCAMSPPPRAFVSHFVDYAAVPGCHPHPPPRAMPAARSYARSSVESNVARPAVQDPNTPRNKNTSTRKTPLATALTPEQLVARQRADEKNRLKVRRHYYRKIETLNALRATVERLEEQLRSLQAATQSRSQLDLVATRQELEREHIHLAWRVLRHRETAGWLRDLLSREDELFTSPALAKTQFIKPFTAAECQAMRDRALAEVLQFSCQQVHGQTLRGPGMAGWQDEVTLDDEVFRFSLEKTFRQLTPSMICGRTWPLVADPQGFARLFSPSVEAKCVVVQRVDAANVVLFQEYRTMDAANEYVIMKSLLLLSRVATATGELILMRGLGQDRLTDPELFLEAGAVDARQVVWQDFFSWVKYDRAGLYGRDCVAQFGGVAPRVGNNAAFWAVEVLNLVIRWECAIYGPPKLLPAANEEEEQPAATTVATEPRK